MISVIFASYNGEKTLPLMLDAFCQLEVPTGGWKIIAVDNASTDHSTEIIQSYCDRLPITYLYEEKKGKNYALNSGLALAEGDLFVFTDDDVIPDKNWLLELQRASDENLDYHLFGGRIMPRWPCSPPEWILKQVQLGVVFAVSKEELNAGPIDPVFVMGPNMAVRASVFKTGIMFDSAIGPNGQSYAMGSETDFNVRLCQAGFKSFYTDKAIVQHIIRHNQLERDWILNRAYRFGRGRFLYEKLTATLPKTVEILSMPRWMLFKYFKLGIKRLLNGTNFEEDWDFFYLKGYLHEYRLNKY